MSLLEHNQASLTDINNQNDIEVEVNFTPEATEQNLVKFKIGDKEAVISIAELHMLTFTLVDPERQADLVPVKQEIVQKMTKVHLVEVTKDLRKGEKLKFRCEVNVPVDIYNGLYGNIKKWNERKQASSPIILPKISTPKHN